MNSKYHIFIYIIFFINIYKIFSSIYLKYPYSLYLSNGNILVIHEKGITIYDHLFSKSIKEILTFSEKDKLKIGDASKITTTFEDEYIFCLIKDQIYIFNDIGNLIFHNNTSILKNEVFPKYYSLVVIKIEDNLYKYVINYLFDRKLYWNYFQYNTTSNENMFISYHSQNQFSYSYSYGSTYYQYSYLFDDNYALSCQYMINKDKNNIFICFFMLEHKLYISFYNIGEKSIFLNEDILPNSNSEKDFECIKSIVNPNHSKALITLYSSTGEMKSFIFSIDQKNIYSIDFNNYFKNNFCKRNYVGLNVYYFKQNEEYINSCLDNNGNLLVEFYDQNFNIYNYQIINYNKTNIFRYSILYSNCTGKYFFVSEEEPFRLLVGDNEQLENIKQNFRIEDCLNIDNKEESESQEKSETSDKSDESEKKSEASDNSEESKEKSETSNYSKDDSKYLLLIIIIVLLCCVILALVGYLIYKNCKNRPINPINPNINELFEVQDVLPAPIIN